ncbi:MAG: transglutaminase family protein [Planctomycetia bacterium]|nr:transglutaminase family protein [Planctomycetia bacterium]
MSTLRIEHHTVYRYARPIEFGQHRLVLRPREGHDLHVARMTLDIFPKHRLNWSRDVFGNSVVIVDFLEEADRLEFRSEVLVERSLPLSAEEPHKSPQVAFPVEYDTLETVVVGAYQTASYSEDRTALQSWLDQALPARDADAESLAAALNLLVHRQIKYFRRNERGVQSPAETLALGSGSCRDMATLLMDAARVLGFATRFASGYLDCAASLAGRASTHAWIEVYLPLLGWRGFDPTLGEPTSLKHVVTGVSNHPRGVMPISGSFNGTSADYLGMNVAVTTERVTASP